MGRQIHKSGIVFEQEENVVNFIFKWAVIVFFILSVFQLGRFYERKKFQKDIEIQASILTPGELK